MSVLSCVPGTWNRAQHTVGNNTEAQREQKDSPRSHVNKALKSPEVGTTELEPSQCLCQALGLGKPLLLSGLRFSICVGTTELPRLCLSSACNTWTRWKGGCLHHVEAGEVGAGDRLGLAGGGRAGSPRAAPARRQPPAASWPSPGSGRGRSPAAPLSARSLPGLAGPPLPAPLRQPPPAGDRSQSSLPNIQALETWSQSSFARFAVWSWLPVRPTDMATMVAQKLSHLLPSLRQFHQEPQPSVQPEPVFTVDRAEVPPLFWKPYIYVGYRPLHQTWRFYFRTLFQQHNEVVNVWTHLLAALVLLLRLAIFVGTVDFRGDPHALPLFIIVLASFTYLSLSALAHLLQAKSEFWHYSFFFLDYVGVAVYQFGSALAHFYYAIEPAWHAQVQTIFLPMAAFLAWLSCTGSCYSKYIQRPGLLGRTCQEVPSALAYALDISPVAHRILVSPSPTLDDPALLYHKCQVVFFLLAAAFFSAFMPERWFPGSCHMFGQGHQVFHVFLVLCTLAQLEAVALDYEARRPIYEPLHTRWPHDFAGLFLLTVGSSVLTAFLLSQLVQRKLNRKTQ
ncbi:progestin and adipoQ receptor family member 7 [Rhinolophus ferrumequinum]|uniref:Progestin and adipoQ receptor family member 7 n=2 Tax=Rhinolophus ferrumequinum TaxID=59479 RepID=A0A7J7X6U7_RHIFE|nr:progestin and adipoQ receptor family member 7 [Rhinolophus ferrumequinum]